jgi:hypothetical protein
MAFCIKSGQRRAFIVWAIPAFRVCQNRRREAVPGLSLFFVETRQELPCVKGAETAFGHLEACQVAPHQVSAGTKAGPSSGSHLNDEQQLVQNATLVLTNSRFMSRTPGTR